ncbi:MAG: ferrous iron transport protein A [Armatimonadetes bacterium]|nr:ferrous iron transport protein A [Armatimonadota bacterium]
MRLRELRVGDRAVVVGYAEGDTAYRSKLLAMGLTKGSIIKVVKVAPLGDPVKVEVRGYDLSLRKGEADVLLVECER